MSRRASNTAEVDERIRELVATAPPLSPERREWLAVLLREGLR